LQIHRQPPCSCRCARSIKICRQRFKPPFGIGGFVRKIQTQIANLEVQRAALTETDNVAKPARRANLHIPTTRLGRPFGSFNDDIGTEEKDLPNIYLAPEKGWPGKQNPRLRNVCLDGAISAINLQIAHGKGQKTTRIRPAGQTRRFKPGINRFAGNGRQFGFKPVGNVFSLPSPEGQPGFDREHENAATEDEDGKHDRTRFGQKPDNKPAAFWPGPSGSVTVVWCFHLFAGFAAGQSGPHRGTLS